MGKAATWSDKSLTKVTDNVEKRIINCTKQNFKEKHISASFIKIVF